MPIPGILSAAKIKMQVDVHFGGIPASSFEFNDHLGWAIFNGLSQVQVGFHSRY